MTEAISRPAVVTTAALAAERAVGAPRLLGASERTAAEFAELYNGMFRDLSGYCAALVRDEQLAVDIAQEAFTRLFARWRSVRDARAFVFVVATNLVRDEWRRRSRHSALLSSVGPLTAATTPEHDSALHDVVVRLPRRLRDVAVMHLVLDLPVAEVARVLGVPAGTVKRRLHEARARLRRDWAED